MEMRDVRRKESPLCHFFVFTIFLILCLLEGSRGVESTLYVSSDGSSIECSSSNPCSLSYAVTSIPPNGTISLLSGTFLLTETLFITADNITLLSASNNSQTTILTTSNNWEI